MALGNQNVRAVCLRDKLEFKFFFSFLFFFSSPVISEQSINFVLFLWPKPGNEMEGKWCFVYFWYLLDRLFLLITLLVLKIRLCYVSSDSDIFSWKCGDLSSSGMVAIKAILWAICVNGNLHNATTLLSGSAFQIISKELLLTGQ